DLPSLAGELAGRDQLADRAAERAVDGAGRAAGRGDALEQVHDQRLALPLLEAGLRGLQDGGRAGLGGGGGYGVVGFAGVWRVGHAPMLTSGRPEAAFATRGARSSPGSAAPCLPAAVSCRVGPGPP